jgi:hypothetical protein
MTMRIRGVKEFIIGALITFSIVFGNISYADNPIIQTKFTADPAQMMRLALKCLTGCSILQPIWLIGPTMV